ncbi:MAG: methyltransferase [Proteobacteria bacterium]|nr:methyltransferase [Pseudomonadota bacterium]MBI3496850.1 methyltransferase [Pseudomonadota bacterium]
MSRVGATQDPEDFVLSQTALAVAALVPELRLYLASEVVPLWQATEASLEASGLPPPYWAFAWPGGQALARYLFDHPETVRGQSVLDLAAGGGVAGIAAAKLGAAVSLSEIDRFAATAIRLNAGANRVAVEVLVRDVLDDPPGAWSLILAGDLCYERPMAERVISWLRRNAAAGALVLMGDPGRAYRPQHGLEEVARYLVPTSLDLEDRLERETLVWRILPSFSAKMR